MNNTGVLLRYGYYRADWGDRRRVIIVRFLVAAYMTAWWILSIVGCCKSGHGHVYMYASCFESLSKVMVIICISREKVN